MNPTVQNILAVVTGIIIGSVVNMGIVMISSSIIPPPEGVDASNMESLAANMHLFTPKHFIFPFLAHALGTFFGALISARIATHRKIIFALTIGVIFLIGGISSIFMLPSPTWFNILDLSAAYIPMGWIAWKIVAINNKK